MEVVAKLENVEKIKLPQINELVLMNLGNFIYKGNLSREGGITHYHVDKRKLQIDTLCVVNA